MTPSVLLEHLRDRVPGWVTFSFHRTVGSHVRRVAVSLSAVLLVLLGCQKPPEPRAAPRTVAELYQRVDEAMVRPGQVLHIVSTAAAATGSIGNEGRTETWVDALRATARIEVNGGNRGTRSMLYVDDTRYYKDWDGQRGSDDREHCYGAGVASVVVLSCPPDSDPLISEHVEQAAYQDRLAIPHRTDRRLATHESHLPGPGNVLAFRGGERRDRRQRW